MAGDDIPGQPDLDEYGIAVPPPPTSRPRLMAASYLACALIEGSAVVAYARNGHRNVPAGLHTLVLGAGLIGVLAFVGLKKVGKHASGLEGLPRAVFVFSLFAIVVLTISLLLFGLLPQVVWCHHNCTGGY